MREAVGEVLGTFQADTHDEVDAVKRELELTRRELKALREEVALERSLRDLRSEVEEARKQVPSFPAIAERLEADHQRLRAELDATKNKMRANQSIAEYGISELRKQAWAATKKATSVEMKVETESRFTMRDIDPAAAEALREFAPQIVSARTRGWIFLAGTA
jgi:chromosome segregation ATPase